MRKVLFGVVLSVLSFVGTGTAQNVTVEGTVIKRTVIDIRPSAKGGSGRIVVKSDRDGIIKFHITKDTTIFVDGKIVEATRVTDLILAEGTKVLATYNGKLMESDPPQALTIQLEILKPAK